MRRTTLLLALALAGCAGSAADVPDVLVSTYPVAFLAERLAGDNVTLGPVAPDDLDRARGAELVLVHGAGVEPWIEDVRRSTRVGVATEGIRLNGTDPHVWLDPLHAISMLRNVEKALMRAFPPHAEAFGSRANALAEELEDLHEEFQAGLATCDARVVVTDRDAFRYVGARYGFEPAVVQGLDPATPPDAATRSELASLVRRHGATVVFVEAAPSADVAQAIAATGAAPRVLHPLDAPPAAGDPLSAMRENLAGLREALRCA